MDGYNDTLNGIHNALAADLNVSLNTPLCSLNRDYLSVVKLAHTLGIRYLTCSGLIPAGNADTAASRAVRLTPAELEETLRPAMEYAAANGIEISFTSPGWLPEETLRALGFTQIPSCGACLSNMAIAPDGTVLPCQSWLTGKGLGNLLRTPWPRIWHSHECRAIRKESAKMAQRCQLGDTPMQELPMKMQFMRRLALLCAVLACGALLALPAAAAQTEAPCAEDGDMDYIRSYVVTVDPREDGSADITYDIDWQVIDGDKTDYLSWVKIGLANSSVNEMTPLTDTIYDLQYSDDGGSYAKVVFTQRYYSPAVAAQNGGESSVRFAFRVHQSHLFTKNDDGTATFNFTPGWFDDLSVENMQVRWRNYDGFVAITPALTAST